MALPRRTLLAVSLGLAGIALPRVLRAAQPLTVVATTGMIADIVRQVAGERAEVTALMGEGLSRSAAARQVAAETGHPRRALFDRVD